MIAIQVLINVSQKHPSRNRLQLASTLGTVGTTLVFLKRTTQTAYTASIYNNCTNEYNRNLLRINVRQLAASENACFSIPPTNLSTTRIIYILRTSRRSVFCTKMSSLHDTKSMVEVSMVVAPSILGGCIDVLFSILFS